MKRLVYIFVLLFLLSACTDDRRVLSLLDRAEAQMEASPDSASLLLHAADSTIAQQSEP
ncbi:MAG: lipoprotein, partial [Bacteroidaceae bacterium]|nr:lipoprotein [Bacteroidaceae bacterium]